jgi:hypothetical protein
MNNREIAVIVQNNGVTLARGNSGAEASGRIELDRLHRGLIGVFEEWLNSDSISRRSELEVFGALLYRALFGGELGTFFEQMLGDLTPGERLRLQLSFQEGASELARLPWEYLYCPDTDTRPGFFLSTNVNLVFSRYIPLQTGRQTLLPGEAPLRILIVVSQPVDVAPVIAEPVIEAIEKQPEVEIQLLDKPTVDNFLDKLMETRPHVLHFIGHGRFEKTEKTGEIAFLGPDEKSVLWVRDREFTEFFLQMRAQPRLGFLHLCEGATVDLSANFAGLAPQLIRAGIPAVVAMQYPITNMAAIAFSRAFYRALANGAPVDQAVQTGRWRITVDIPNAYHSRVFGTPVLYMHSSDGIIRPAAVASTR